MWGVKKDMNIINKQIIYIYVFVNSSGKGNLFCLLWTSCDSDGVWIRQNLQKSPILPELLFLLCFYNVGFYFK